MDCFIVASPLKPESPSTTSQTLYSTNEALCITPEYKDIGTGVEKLPNISEDTKVPSIEPTDELATAIIVPLGPRGFRNLVLEPLGNRVCYFDTDSIIYRHLPLQWNPTEGSSLGEWKNELPENVHITQFVAGGPKNYAYQLSNGSNVVIAAFVTAQARLKLYSVLEPLGNRVCYFDTDSIIYRHLPLQWNPTEGSSLGEWKNELPENVHITQFVAGGPKNYAYQLSNGETVCKMRGFTLTYRGMQQLNFETVKNMEKPKDEDIDAVLGSLIEDPKGHVQLWENEDDWSIDVEKELRKFWKEVPGLRMILPTWRKEKENC
ncbi:hypothetical protein LOTGIDRAFT_175919 [Lottia gigantea]|uniref:Uncharacterized protein n=1 Tax=Lottia gigantea TaxID=225164 RepID=V3ZZH8_LOTGI|nr:hypothetical protein LOTGIDRAFT_175919 [Lottia gigantea]ESO88065.1 hypothetical protein LOTGIDRAFT_175919 [Lottia gigantea]